MIQSVHHLKSKIEGAGNCNGAEEILQQEQLMEAHHHSKLLLHVEEHLNWEYKLGHSAAHSIGRNLIVFVRAMKTS